MTVETAHPTEPMMTRKRPARPATPATAPTSPTAPASPVTGPATVSGKLRMGQLRAMVADYLATHPGPHTPGVIAKALDRSAGAVGNALTSLTGRGEAEMASDRPQRYSATPTTAAAALAPPSRTPRTAPASAPASPATTTPPATTPPTTSASTPTPPAKVTGPITRPNRMTYHPRALADLPDVTALRKLRDAGIPALLYGPPGTGKTSLIEAAFDDLITLAGDGDTSVADLIGEYTQKPDGGYEFIYGPLIIAMQEGRALLIDDATLVSPKVLAVAYPAMDGRRQIQVKAHRGETVTAATGFYVIAGHNPGVHGAVLTEALASRFAAQIEVSTDYDLAAALKIDIKAVRVAKNLATKKTRGEIGWAPQLRELIAFQRLSSVLGPEAAIANLVGIAPEEDRDVVAATVALVFGRPFTPLSLGRQI